MNATLRGNVMRSLRSHVLAFFENGEVEILMAAPQHLLLRQDKSMSHDKIVFHINKKEIEFRMNEF